MQTDKKPIDVEVREFFQTQFKLMKEEDPSLCACDDPTLFIVLCLKYYYFRDSQYTYNDILDVIVDGSSDGSLDALLVDTSIEECPLVAIQSKYRTTYDHTNAKGEIEEMRTSLKNLSRQKYENYSQKVRDRYIACLGDLIPGQSSTNFVYFSSFVPKKRSKNKFCDEINNDNTMILFGDDIKSDIEAALETTGRVKYGELLIDEANKLLTYEESCIVNISASSLKELYGYYRRSLLGLNLRYFVKNPTVDDGLKKTIKSFPKQFWYLNNGIVITCESWEIQGRILKLNMFSIVNGGQTTDKLFKTDFDDDFFLPCKVVKTETEDELNDDRLTSRKIAIASNSQKPIQKKDLESNKKEQVALKAKLKACGVQYLIKGGETIEKQYKNRDKHISLDQLGKLGLSAVAQRPWTRAGSSEQYDDSKPYYYIIYRETEAQLYADLLVIDNYYKKFVLSNYSTNNRVLSNNARTYVLASLVLIALFIQNPSDPVFEKMPQNETDMERYIKKIVKMRKLLIRRIDDEQEVFYKLFGAICDYALGIQFQIAKGVDENLVESNFLKAKESYYRSLPEIIKRLKNRDTDIYANAVKMFK